MKSGIFLIVCGLVLVPLSRPQSSMLNDADSEYECFDQHFCQCGESGFSWIKYCYDLLGEESKKVVASDLHRSGLLDERFVDYNDVSTIRDIICPQPGQKKKKGFEHAWASLEAVINYFKIQGSQRSGIEVRDYEMYKQCLAPVMKFCPENPGKCIQ